MCLYRIVTIALSNDGSDGRAAVYNPADLRTLFSYLMQVTVCFKAGYNPAGAKQNIYIYI